MKDLIVSTDDAVASDTLWSLINLIKLGAPEIIKSVTKSEFLDIEANQIIYPVKKVSIPATLIVEYLCDLEVYPSRILKANNCIRNIKLALCVPNGIRNEACKVLSGKLIKKNVGAKNFFQVEVYEILLKLLKEKDNEIATNACIAIFNLYKNGTEMQINKLFELKALESCLDFLDIEKKPCNKKIFFDFIECILKDSKHSSMPLIKDKIKHYFGYGARMPMGSDKKQQYFQLILNAYPIKKTSRLEKRHGIKKKDKFQL